MSVGDRKKEREVKRQRSTDSQKMIICVLCKFCMAPCCRLHSIKLVVSVFVIRLLVDIQCIIHIKIYNHTAW